MKKYILIGILAFFFIDVTGQGKYFGLIYHPGSGPKSVDFVTIDPYLDNKTVISTIPGIASLTGNVHAFNTDSNIYMFVGADEAEQKYYICLNALTGAVLAKTPVTNPVRYTVYNPLTRLYYGISGASYVSFSPYTGVKTVLNTYTGVGLINGFHTINTDSNRYVFTSIYQNASESYYVINASTGELISKSTTTIISRLVTCIFYSPANKLYYGFLHGQYCSINPYTSTRDTIASISGMIDDPFSIAFDKNKNHYIFYKTSGTLPVYYVLDAATGAEISHRVSNEGDVTLLEYANIQGTGTNNIERSAEHITVYPNPVINGTLRFNYPGISKYDAFDLAVFDLSGKKIIDSTTTLNEAIDVSELTPGIYFARLTNGEINFFEKFVVE